MNAGAGLVTPLAGIEIRLLLVEDDPVDQMAFKRTAIAEAWPFQWQVAASLAEARRLVEEQEFDVIISDYLLGDGSGLDNFPHYGDTPVIMTTASGSEEVAVAAMKLGASDYLIKDPARNYLKVLPLTVQISLERQRDREKMKRLLADLAGRSAELEAANAQLAHKNEELENFSYIVAHDLRAPLRAISGFIGIALEDCRDGLGAAGIDLLGRVNERTRYMDRLIEALMLLYRSDQSNLAIETVDLAEIAREEISQLQAREPGRKVEWLVAAPLVAEADRRLISNVLANLIGNAWKFTMYRDTARIEIGALQQAGEKVFYVRDNGAGFDAAAGGLFQPLRRLHSSKDFPGYGIGLASAKKIIERHRGRIWAEAAVDRGAAIYFSLGRAGAVLPAD